MSYTLQSQNATTCSQPAQSGVLFKEKPLKLKLCPGSKASKTMACYPKSENKAAAAKEQKMI